MKPKDKIIQKYQNEISDTLSDAFRKDPAFETEYKEVTNFQREIETETDRGMVLFGVARVDVLLEELLRKKLIGSNNHLKTLFDNTGALSTFSSRIRLAYSIGLISESQHTEIHLLRELRNKFAHSDQAIGFNSGEIAKICEKFTYIMQLPEPFHRKRVAATISLLYLQIRLEIRNVVKFPTKRDYYAGDDKKLIDERTDNLKKRMKDELGLQSLEDNRK